MRRFLQSHRFVVCAVLAAAAFVPGPDASAADPPSGTKAYVPRDDGNVTVIDLATRTVLKTLQIGYEPRGIDTTPDQRYAFVANSQGSDIVGVSTSPTVSMIDTIDDIVVQTIILTRFGAYDCAVTPDGTRVYVACSSAYVCVIDVATRAQVDEIELTQAGNLESLAVSPDGAKVYVVNRGAATLEVIDTATNTVVGAPIAVNTAPRDVAFSADGTKAIVVGDSSPQIFDVGKMNPPPGSASMP